MPQKLKCFKMAEIWNTQIHQTNNTSQRKVYTVTSQPVTFANARGCQVQYCGQLYIYLKMAFIVMNLNTQLEDHLFWQPKSLLFTSSIYNLIYLLASQFFQYMHQDTYIPMKEMCTWLENRFKLKIPLFVCQVIWLGVFYILTTQQTSTNRVGQKEY